MFIFLIILHVIACIGLIAIVLLQTGKGTGLANVFGSGGGVQSVFGAQTGDVLTRSTAVLAGLYMITSVSLAGMSMKKSSSVMKAPRATRRAAEMPSGLPIVPQKSTQDLLQQIKDAAQGVKEAVQKRIPLTADQGAPSAEPEAKTLPLEKTPVDAAPAESMPQAGRSAPETVQDSVPAGPAAVDMPDQPASPIAPDQQQ
jgi:preprotein translocase subunit SecG